MIADEVAGVGDSAGEFSFVLHKFADHEKCCAYVVGSEDVEESRRPRWIGAVVEGKGELSGIAWRDEGAAEKL